MTRSATPPEQGCWQRPRALSLTRAGVNFLPWLAERKGLHHLAGNGFASRFEWAKEILKLDPKAHEQVTKELIPATTVEFPTPARRPLFSAVECAKFKSAFGLQLPDWKQALALAMQDIPKL